MARSIHSDHDSDRPINWYETASRSIGSRFPDIRFRRERVIEALSGLLLERLPRELSLRLYALLPDGATPPASPLRIRARTEETRDIGYVDFLRSVVEAAQIGDREAREIVDYFLWTIAHEIPPELKARMRESLPRELTSRMNLYSAVADHARVA